MIHAIRRPPPTPSTLQRSEDDVEISSLGAGPSLRSQGVSSFRTLRSNDKGVETSLPGRKVRDDKTQAGGGAVQDVPVEPMIAEDDGDPFGTDDRARSIAALLMRRESQEVIERILTTDDPTVQQERLGWLLLSSHDVLYSFARLVTEGGLTVADGCLRTTPLMDRILQALPEKTTKP